MKHQLLIDVGLFETRAAALTQGRLTDISYYRPDNAPAVGEIYLGRIRAFAKGLDAAFIDLGSAGDAFLLARDVPIGTKKTPISEKLHEGQKIILQIIKDRKGDKDYQVSGFIKLESRNLVYNPNGSGLSFSKKLKNDTLKQTIIDHIGDILEEDGGGITVRSRMSAKSLDTLKAEIASLITNWTDLEQSSQSDNKPRCLSPKDPPVIAAYKKHATDEISISINERSSFELLKRHLTSEAADETQLNLWNESDLLFDAFDAEEQIEMATEKRVPLPSGGNVTIEQTEALIVIDVNSGSHIEAGGRSGVALNTNQEAAHVICQQIRLCNLSGIIIIDFIQMQDKGAIGNLTRLLSDLTRTDPAQVRVIGMTELGLMQLTRQRQAASLSEQLAQPLDTELKIPTALVSTLLRDLIRHHRSEKKPNITVKTGSMWRPLFDKRKAAIENHLSLNIIWKEDPSLRIDEYQLGG